MGHYDDHNAPAINMLTAQLLRYGWSAPRLSFLKNVPQQGYGYASGGRRNADLFRRAMSALATSRPAAYFEIAPGETWDKNLQMAWETLKDAEKRRITERALADTFKPWQEASGIRGDLASGVGGYKGFTNPSKIFRPENPDHIAYALNDLGENYAQDAMMGVGMQPFAGSSPTGLVSIQFPKGVEQDRVHDIYQRLMRRGLVEGHSTDLDQGVMSMLAGKGGRDTKRIAKGIDREVGGEYPVWAQRAHVSFPENRVNYGLYRDASSVRPETLWTGPGRAPEIGAPEEFKAASRDHVRSLIEEALGAPQGASALVGRAAGGRRNAADAALELARRLGRMSPEGSGYQSVPGKPSTVDLPGFGRVEARPIPEIEAAAAAYNRSRGLPAHTVDSFAPINPAFSAKVAREFDRMAHDPSDPLVRRAYDALIDDTLAQYRAAKDTGIDFRFLKPGQADPYAASPALGYEDIVNRGRLFVFPTDQGFGTLNKAALDNPLLRRVGRVGDKDDAVANDAFRVVHDLYGHFGPGNPFFRAPGEERAFQLHSRMYSPEALPAATAETRGQNSWVNYGPAGEHNRRANPADTIYADQKIGRMPSWTAAPPPAEGADVEGYIRSLIRNGRARGGSLIQDRFPTHYLPGVGRQVMADGGAAPSMNDLMANVNSVFSRKSRPAFSMDDMIGRAPNSAGRGAHTDAGGLKVTAPFVSSMRNGYPVFSQTGAYTDAGGLKVNAPFITAIRGGYPVGYDKGGVAKSIRAAQKVLAGYTDPKTQYKPRAAGGRTGFGSGGWRQFADVVEQAMQKARDVNPRDRLNVYHNVDAQHLQPLLDRFNGIPAPSLAISKPFGNPAENFGTATLIGRPHLAIPTQDNHVFGADAYTPRFPRIFEAKPEAGVQQDFMFKAPGDFTEVPVSVENVLNHMRSRPLLGGEGSDTGIGLLKAHLAPRPKSLEEMQRNRHKIAEDENEESSGWSYLQNRIMTLGHMLGQHAHETSKYPGDQLSKAMIDFHNEGPSGLYKTYKQDLPQENVGRIQSILREVNELRPSYMEAKPMRNVGFDEFGAAVLPSDKNGKSAAETLKQAGMPQENIHFYFEPDYRFQLYKRLSKDYGFERGGSVEQAMDIVRNADFEPRRMEPSADDIGMLRRMAQVSHYESGPGVVEKADAYLPLPFGRKVPLGQMPASTVRGVEMLAPIAAMGAQIAANFHPATRAASRALDIAQGTKFAGDVYKTGHGDMADFFSMFPSGKADALGMISAFTNPNSPHEPAREVLNRMREGRERGGRRQAVESLAKILQGAPEYPGKSSIPLDEAYKFVVNPHHPSEDVAEAARSIIDKWGQNVGSNKKGGYYNLEQALAPKDVKPRIRQIPGLRLLTPNQMTWDDFYNIGKGGSFINLGGDRSNFGRLFGINGQDLAWPVDLHAGAKYALEPSPGAIWANAQGPATSLQNAIRRAAQNDPVYGILSPMGPQSVNSSHNMVDTLLAQIPGRLNSGDLAHTTLDDFTDFVKSGRFAAAKGDREKRIEEMKDFPGMRDPKAVSEFLRTVSGGARRDFSLAMDKEKWRDVGMPMVGQTRVAITDPALLRAPSGGMGHRIVKFNTDNLTPPSVAFTHSTYPVATAGEYVGDVPLLPRHYVMPTAQESMMQKLASDSSVIHPLSVGPKGRDSARKFFEEQQLVQPIDEDFLHSVNEGMKRKSIYGFRKGGSVVKLARDVLFPKRDAA